MVRLEGRHLFSKNKAKKRIKALPNQRLGAYAKTIREGIKDKTMANPSNYV
jgi:hypothetical protein